MKWEESRALYDQGRKAMVAGDLEKAVTLLRRSHLVVPHCVTLELIGECLLGLDRPVEAIEPPGGGHGRSTPWRARCSGSAPDSERPREAPVTA